MAHRIVSKFSISLKNFQKPLITTASMALAILLSTTAVYADPGQYETPTNFNLIEGDVNAPVLSGANNQNMDIQQNSLRAVINWKTFNIGSDASVEFNQTQGANSVAVNRVTNSTIGSEIFGQLKSNGKIMILDKNGVFFDQNSSIDVGGIIASSADMNGNNRDRFMAGQSFTLTNADGNPNAKVINNSNSFNIKDSGLAAFVAPWVENNGIITAKLGEVTLGAGKRLTVDFSGDELINLTVTTEVQNAFVKNAGLIDAQGGKVNMTAVAASDVVDDVINMSGVIKANSFSTHNGKIILSSKGGGRVNVSGTLDVSRAGDDAAAGTSAGTILIEGKDILISAAARILADISTVETPIIEIVPIYSHTYSYTYSRTKIISLFPFRTQVVNTTITASSKDGLIAQLPSDLQSIGDAIKIGLNQGVTDIQTQTGTQEIQTGTLISKGSGNGGTVDILASNTVSFAGLIDVGAGGDAGNGGSVEISGAGGLGYFGLVDASAENGTRGSLLLDPAVITVSSAVAGDIVNLTALKNTLNLTDTTLLADEQISFAEAADFSSADGHLTLDAPRLSFLGDFTTKTGGVTFIGGETVDLGGKLYRKDFFSVMLNDADLPDMASTVNILSSAANIQQGISLAASGATINVSSGTYNENLDIYKSLTLQAVGAATLSGFLANSTVLISADDVTVDGFSISGFTLNGISATDVSGLTLSDNSFTGFLLGSGIKLDGVDNSTVSGNNFTGVNTAINAFGGDGYLTISGNTVLGANIGISLADSANSQVLGNTVTGTLGDAIVIDNADDLTVAGNIIVAAGGNGISISDTEGATVTLNAVLGAGEHGINLNTVEDVNLFLNAAGGSKDALHVDGAKDINIFLNAFGLTSENGVSISNAEDTNVFLNLIAETGEDGVKISESNDVIVAANAILNAGGNGITVLDTTDAGILLNYVSGAGNDGIYIDPTTGYAALNYITGATNNGITVSDSDGFVVAANYIDGSGNDGIHISQSDNVVTTLNTVKNSGNNGIHIWDSEDSYVFLNKIESSGNDGIHLSSSGDAFVALNSISGSGNNGIHLWNSDETLILLNKVDGSDNDGIHISNSDKVLTTLNKVTNSGNDGIHVWGSSLNAIALNHIDGTTDGDGISVSTGFLNTISFNKVENTDGNGISLYNNGFSSILGNDIFNSGENGIETTESGFVLLGFNKIRKSGDNGILIGDVTGVSVLGNKIRNSGDDGIHVSGSRFVDITGNRIRKSGDDGIQADDVDGYLNIARNNIRNVGSNGISVNNAEDLVIRRNRLTNGGSTGIAVSNSYEARVRGNRIDDFYTGIIASSAEGIKIRNNRINNSFQDGIRVSYSPWSDITGNTITNYGEDGIQLTYGSDHSLIAGNLIDAGTYTGSIIGFSPFLLEGSGSQTTGIRLGDNYFPWFFSDNSGVHDVMVSGNTVLNNDIGLNATAFNNGYIAIEGNQFTDNNIGLWIGSGLIDLTGETNTFTGGDIAMRFERQQTFSWGFPSLYIEGPSQESPFEPEVLYSELALVDETIGTTVFEGQSTYYIELLNGAFFDPGTPTIIDGTQATYDGVSGGLMTAEQLLQIESMIHDYDDDGSLGQIFAGFSPLDDNLILKKIRDNAYKAGKAGVIITGLPSTQGANTGNRFFSIQDLANLEPAAGGDNNGQTPTAEELAGLEPAAGDEGDDLGDCWSNAATAMGGAGVVSLDLSDEDPSAVLADQSACDSGI